MTSTGGGDVRYRARIQAGYVFADGGDRPEASFAHIVQARLELGR